MRTLSALVLLVVATGCDDAAPVDDRTVGMTDPAATLSCTAATDSPTAVTAAATMDAADGAVIEVPGVEDVANVYSVTLPESGESYAALRLSVMHNNVTLFVSERDRIVHLAPDGISSSLRHGVCPDVLIDDYRTHIHAPGDYVLTFAADGPREFTIVAINQMIGHIPGGGDGGMHMHDEDGGTHMHDAGEHMDHDAGDHMAHDAGEHMHDGG